MCINGGTEAPASRLGEADLRSHQEKKERKDAITTFVMEYVNDNLADEIYLDTLAEKLNISSGYLSTYFKEKTGINMMDYINEARVRKAAVSSGGNPHRRFKKWRRLLDTVILPHSIECSRNIRVSNLVITEKVVFLTPMEPFNTETMAGLLEFIFQDLRSFFTIYIDI